MLRKRKVILILISMVFIIGISAVRINTYSPVGAIRYECFLKGHVISAFFLNAVKSDLQANDVVTVYKITSFIPYEKATATHLDQWNVRKNKNGTYSAAYGVG